MIKNSRSCPCLDTHHVAHSGYPSYYGDLATHREAAIAELGRSVAIQADASSSGSVIGFVGMTAIPAR
jgi:hypothetical protein